MILNHTCTHKLDVCVDRKIRLVAASYSFTSAGIQCHVMDVDSSSDAMNTEQNFFCRRCNKIIPASAENEIFSKCCLCGYVKPVGELFYNSKLDVVCNSCVTGIKKVTSKNFDRSDVSLAKFMDIVAVYDLRSFKIVKLASILSGDLILSNKE